MKQFLLLSFVGAFLSSVGFAVELRRLELYANITYQDDTGMCKTMRGGAKVLFSAEIEDGKVTRAVVANHPYEFPFTHIYKSFEVVAQTASPIELWQDKTGHYWLKRWFVSEAQLAWLLYHPHRGETCSTPQLIGSVLPKGVVFEFETDDINDGLLLSYSQRARLEGKRIDGKPFEGSLRLLQKQPWDEFYDYVGGIR